MNVCMNVCSAMVPHFGGLRGVLLGRMDVDVYFRLRMTEEVNKSRPLIQCYTQFFSSHGCEGI